MLMVWAPLIEGPGPAWARSSDRRRTGERKLSLNRGRRKLPVCDVRRCQEFWRSGVAMGLSVCWRRQRDSSLGREQQERQRLLEVEAHDAIGMVQIADRNVLPDVQIKIAAARGEHEGTCDGGSPDDLVLDEL